MLWYEQETFSAVSFLDYSEILRQIKLAVLFSCKSTILTLWTCVLYMSNWTREKKKYCFCYEQETMEWLPNGADFKSAPSEMR